MSWLNFLRGNHKQESALLAKKRLQIIVAEHRQSDKEPHYLPQLKKDILAVLCKYVEVDMDQVSVQLDQQTENNVAILELNIPLPDFEKPLTQAVDLEWRVRK